MLYFAALLALAKPLGWYMARVYQGQPCGLDRALGWLERGIYRVAGVDPSQEMGWRHYAVALLASTPRGFLPFTCCCVCRAACRSIRSRLPATTPDLAFDTAASFATNTNWQSYGGETTLSYLSQMLGLTVQNFVSAATGMAVLVALIRGLARRNAKTIGNFWVDLVRSTLYILLPLSLVLAHGAGVAGRDSELQARTRTLQVVEPHGGERRHAVTTQTLAMGPAASQIAIKQLGTNGGGFFNVNSAHPFENPTPLSNFLEMLAILLIPAGLCYTFGVMVGDTRQGWAVLAAMLVIFVPLTIGADRGRAGGRAGVRRDGRRRCSRRPRNPAATWKARKCGSASPTRRSGPAPRRPPRTAASIRCTTRSRRWAGLCRCG